MVLNEISYVVVRVLPQRTPGGPDDGNPDHTLMGHGSSRF